MVFLCVGLASAMAVPFLTLFLTDAVRASALQVTIFLIAAPLSSVVVSMAMGHWSDRLPSRRGLIIATAVIGAVGALLTASVRDFWILLALTVTATAAASALVPQVFAHARVSLQGSPHAVMTMTTLRTILSLSWVGGPFLATVLLSLGDFVAVYGFATAMYVIAALVAWRMIPANVPAAVGATEPGSSSVTVSPGRDEGRRVIVLTIAAFVLLQCTGNLSLQALPLFLRDEVQGGLGEAGLILGLCAAIEIPLMLGFGLLAARYRLRLLILAGPLLSLAYALVVATATDTWQIAAAQLINASAIALLQGLGISYVQDLVPSRPGHASTLFTSAGPVGAMLAGPILGAAQGFGYRETYLIGAALAAVAFVLFVLARPTLTGPRIIRTTTVSSRRPVEHPQPEPQQVG
ncbi:sugar efflux transporter SetB [Kineosporia sp. NBRC 101677]|nr:MFS transporter [Kineosporia rhizophila]GLY19797.1 sugar efflux transporter SetB [Kineosporia sp. NBRC 101677]